MRPFLFLLRPERFRIGIAVVALLVSTATSLAFPQLIRQMIDGDGLVSGSLERFVGVALILAVIQGGASYLRTGLFTQVGVRVVARLRKRLFAALLSMPMEDLDGHTSGELSSRLSHDASAVQDALSVTIGHLARHGATAIGALILMCWIAPELTLVALVTLPIMVIVARLHGRKVRRLGTKGSDAVAASATVAVEQIRQIATVRVLQAESEAERAYAAAIDSVQDVGMLRANAAGQFAAASAFSRFGGLAAIVAVGISQTQSGLLTMGDLGAFVVYTMLLAVSVGELASIWGELSSSRGACKRVADWMQANPESSGKIEPLDGTLSFEGVAFRYPSRPDQPVLNDVSFRVIPGETVAVVGRSGAGKSTLARLITKLYAPTIGRIRLGGQDLMDCNTAAVRSRIGVVSQEPVLFTGSIAENIRMGKLDATDEEVWAAAEAAMVLPIVERLDEGFEADVGEGGSRLSGGEKQRVAIARALLSDPEILILDEATSALDVHSEASVAVALERLMAGRSTLVITHRMDQARKADRVIVMDSGRIVQMGSPAELSSIEGVFQKLSKESSVA